MASLRLWESWKRAWIHLRLSFALVLAPLFMWGIYVATPWPIDWVRVVVAFIVVHIFVNGGMNAFNTYWDRDEGPIGGLEQPPPVDETVLVISLIFKAIALVGAFWISAGFGLTVVVALLLSVTYSHPRWRWKENPWIAAAIVFLGQGFVGTLWGWMAARGAPSLVEVAAQLDALTVIGLLGAAFWAISFYPLTGVYQIEEDSQRGIRTVAVCLGVENSFRVAIGVGIFGALGTGAVLWSREAYGALAIGALYLLWAAFRTMRWQQRFAQNTAIENQRMLMQLAYSHGIFFSLLFTCLTIVQVVQMA